MPRLPPELRGPVAVALARSEASVPARVVAAWRGGLRAEVGRLPRRGRAGRRAAPGCGPGKARTSPTGSRTSPPQPSTSSSRALSSTVKQSSGTAPGSTSTSSNDGSSTPPARWRPWRPSTPPPSWRSTSSPIGAKDTRRRPLRERRELLEELAGVWTPPLQLSPATATRRPPADG